MHQGGSGNDAFYVFEPIKPRPRRAPLAIVMHGYGEYAGYDQMYELVRHTVRTGSVVIYPRWQTSIASRCPGPFDIEPCLTSAVKAIRGGISYLRANSGRVQPRLSQTSYLGFSFGGIITANLANRYRALGLPKPGAMFLEDPHDGALAFPKLGHIPKRNKDLVLAGVDTHGDPDLLAPRGVCVRLPRPGLPVRPGEHA